jgi:hypothetical protein
MKPRTKQQRKRTLERRKALPLTLHREWFDAIHSGKKKTEYRENKAYWRKRLVGIAYEEVHFRNGYATDAPFMRVEWRGLRMYGTGRSRKFGIKLGRILEVRNYRKR